MCCAVLQFDASNSNMYRNTQQARTHCCVALGTSVCNMMAVWNSFSARCVSVAWTASQAAAQMSRSSGTSVTYMLHSPYAVGRLAL